MQKCDLWLALAFFASAFHNILFNKSICSATYLILKSRRLSPLSLQSPKMSNIQDLLANEQEWKRQHFKPLGLGAPSGVSVVTCMDSRLIPENMFGFKLGDAEIIRNAGGRVNSDVIRSLVVAQDLVEENAKEPKIVLLIHHTDCGGQHAARRHPELVRLLARRLGLVWGSLYRIVAMTGLDKWFMQPITPPDENGLRQSIITDVDALHNSRLLSKASDIYGLRYDVQTGGLTEVSRRPPNGKPKHQRTA